MAARSAATEWHQTPPPCPTANDGAGGEPCRDGFGDSYEREESSSDWEHVGSRTGRVLTVPRTSNPRPVSHPPPCCAPGHGMPAASSTAPERSTSGVVFRNTGWGAQRAEGNPRGISFAQPAVDCQQLPHCLPGLHSPKRRRRRVHPARRRCTARCTRRRSAATTPASQAASVAAGGAQRRANLHAHGQSQTRSVRGHALPVTDMQCARHAHRQLPNECPPP